MGKLVYRIYDPYLHDTVPVNLDSENRQCRLWMCGFKDLNGEEIYEGHIIWDKKKNDIYIVGFGWYRIESNGPKEGIGFYFEPLLSPENKLQFFTEMLVDCVVIGDIDTRNDILRLREKPYLEVKIVEGYNTFIIKEKLPAL